MRDDIKEKEVEKTENTEEKVTQEKDELVSDDIGLEIDVSEIFDEEKPAGTEDEADDGALDRSYEEFSALERGASGEAGEGREARGEAEEVPGGPAEGPEEAPAERRARKRTSKLGVALFAVLLILSAAALFVILASPLFRITNIEVKRADGSGSYYTDEQIINMSGATVGGNLFLKPQKSKIKKALMKDPYFKSVSVSRKLPDTIVINVEEREQLAALKYGDRSVVISADKHVLRISKTDPEVTMLLGFTIRKMVPGSEVLVEEEQTLDDTMKTLDIIKEGDLYFKKIVVSKNTVDAYIYDGLHVEGTSEELKRAIESGDLKKVLNKIFKKDMDHGRIILGKEERIFYSPAI